MRENHYYSHRCLLTTIQRTINKTPTKLCTVSKIIRQEIIEETIFIYIYRERDEFTSFWLQLCFLYYISLSELYYIYIMYLPSVMNDMTTYYSNNFVCVSYLFIQCMNCIVQQQQQQQQPLCGCSKIWYVRYSKYISNDG